MTCQEKKGPDGSRQPSMIAVRLLVWTLVLGFVAIVALGKID